MTHAIILFGHGSRDALWHLPIQAVAQRIRLASPGVQVGCAYLELTAPTLPDIAIKFIASGANNIRVLPMFLGAGRHAREDLPVLVDALRVRYPKVQFEVLTAIGENEAVLDLMATIALAGMKE
ncbi:MAG: CbiX/SirB N-terminal domain-containing protein [Burkholderiaceae bacterium]|nr:CbiX/SirB N-terminal domain-containing protein [Burkholderiaceae bacterium]